MTRRLYCEDSYKITAKSSIASTSKDGLQLILDETIFYPSSGGQLHDTGTINGVEVLDVWEEHDEIIHKVASPLKISEADCKIDWSRRFDHMQQHTGQHLLTATFEKLYQAPTLSFHLGKAYTTIDIRISKLTTEICEQVETEVNDTIWKNLAVKVYQVPQGQRNQIPFRKPPQVEGSIRVVEIDSLDYSACGGTHVRSIGELGLLKITDFESYKGMYRVSFVCGKRALLNYQVLQRTIHSLKRTLAVPVPELTRKTEMLLETQTTQAKQLKKFSEQLLDYQMQALYHEAPTNQGIKFCEGRFDDQSINLRFAAQKIIHSHPDAICIFLQPAGSKTNILLAASSEVPVRLDIILKQLLDKYEGKGGGSSHLVQGGLTGEFNSESFLNDASDLFLTELTGSK